MISQLLEGMSIVKIDMKISMKEGGEVGVLEITEIRRSTVLIGIDTTVSTLDLVLLDKIVFQSKKKRILVLT